MPTKIRAIGLVQTEQDLFKATVEYASLDKISYQINKSMLEQMCLAMASKNTILIVINARKNKAEIAADVYEFACQIIECNKQLLAQEEKIAYLTISRLILRLDKVSSRLAIRFLKKYLDVKTFDTHIIETCRLHLKYIYAHKGISPELRGIIHDLLSPRSSLSQFNIFTKSKLSMMSSILDPAPPPSHAYKFE